VFAQMFMLLLEKLRDLFWWISCWFCK